MKAFFPIEHFPKHYMENLDDTLDRFDILFKNMSDSHSIFSPAIDSKFNYPVDIYEIKDNGTLVIEIAVVGLKKENIHINVIGDEYLKVSYYNKREECIKKRYATDNEVSNNKFKEEYMEILEEQTSKRYISSNITRKSFDFGWKINSKNYKLDEISITMQDGLLTIKIPRAEAKETMNKEIKIN